MPELMQTVNFGTYLDLAQERFDEARILKMPLAELDLPPVQSLETTDGAFCL